ncbi:MAG: hypothetical protein Ct9H300mP4_12730 [Gammaproteobacteria bacterium]|nr:MAG: hypothetical protein Ct9H300mP4_12730 [Gammaproteobacteria bacterium]
MPNPKDALKGRDQTLTVSPKHYVNGKDVQGLIQMNVKS